MTENSLPIRLNRQAFAADLRDFIPVRPDIIFMFLGEVLVIAVEILDALLHRFIGFLCQMYHLVQMICVVESSVPPVTFSRSERVSFLVSIFVPLLFQFCSLCLFVCAKAPAFISIYDRS